MTKPSAADSGYYLCQAYNYRGSIQSQPAEFKVLNSATIQFSVLTNFSIDWFVIDSNIDTGSAAQRINITDYRVIESALESAINSSSVRIEVDKVSNGLDGSVIKARLFGICTNCDLLNHSLDTIEDEVMDLNDIFHSSLQFINGGISNSEFVVFVSSEVMVRMRVAMASTGNVSIICPPFMRISDEHFFICVSCSPGSYLRNSTCAPCELGHYQDQQGQTSCKKCPSGGTTDMMGSRSIEQCSSAGDITSSSRKSVISAGKITAVVVSTLFVVIAVIALVVYMMCKRYRKKKSKFSTPTIMFQNPVELPVVPCDDDSTGSLNVIPVIRYEDPSTVNSQPIKKSSHSKFQKKHKSEHLARLPKEDCDRNRSYSAAQVKKKYHDDCRVPSCYPIGEYVGSMSDHEGDMYDSIVSPSSTGRRRSMSVSDLTQADSSLLQVPSFLSSIHAKGTTNHSASTTKSGPPAIEMDDDMTDLYDGTIKCSTKDRSYTNPSSAPVRLSGMNIALVDDPAIKKMSGRSSIEARPVTQYVNNEIVEQHRESLTTSDTTERINSRVQSPPHRRSVQFNGTHEEEPAYVTMKPAGGKHSLPDLGSYFDKQPVTRKPSSLCGNPVDSHSIELQSMGTHAHRNSIDTDTVSDSTA